MFKLVTLWICQRGNERERARGWRTAPSPLDTRAAGAQEPSQEASQEPPARALNLESHFKWTLERNIIIVVFIV